MKRTSILVFLALLLLPLCAVAEEEKMFYDYLSDDIRQVLAAEYDGWDVPVGTGMLAHGYWNAMLMFLSKDEKSIAIIMEDKGSGFEIVAVNDAIIPDGVPFDGRWWVSSCHWDYSQAFIWYTPENVEQGFYYELGREDDGGWKVKRGTFGDGDGNSDRLGFNPANNNTALRVFGESSFTAVYVPNEVDLSFSGFDPEGVKAFCAEAMALKNKPALIRINLARDKGKW